MQRSLSMILFVLVLCISAIARADEQRKLPALFDPARHIRVSEIRPGMKGYGLSVFKGTKIEKFDIEVISVLHDFNPQCDVVLIRLKGDYLEHTGSIAGMSGSPIYIHDDAGHDRMLGAFAYGWPLMKDAIGGVQPIEYMLGITASKASTQPATTEPSGEPSGGPTGEPVGAPSARSATTSALGSGARARWELGDVVMLPGMDQPPRGYPLASLHSMRPNPALSVADDSVLRMRPLATPLMMSGLSPQLVEEMTPLLRAYGMTPLQAGGIASGKSGGAVAKLEPGSVLAVPLLIGDVDMTAVGTCTEVIGDRAFGFGHPFNNEGSVAWPMGGGEINGVIASLMTSFKLGAMSKVVGTLNCDDTVGVAGTIGKMPRMIPVHLAIHYTDGSGDREYKFQAAWHSKLTPLIIASAISSAVTGMHELPEFHTLDYDVTIAFANGQTLHMSNSLVNASMPELFFDFGTPMIAAATNPYGEVGVKSVEGTINVTPKARSATILWVNVPRLKYRPGETLKAFVNFRPFRAGDVIKPVEFELPRDLPEGTYQFSISGWEQFLSDERTAEPFRFSAESIGDVFGVLRDMTSIRHDAIYLRLIRQADGIAIGRTAMRNLPSSRREVLIGAGRSNTTPYVSSTTKIVPAGYLMDGSAQFEVTIDKDAHVETGVGKPPRHESAPQPPAPPPHPDSNKTPRPEVPVGPDKEP